MFYEPKVIYSVYVYSTTLHVMFVFFNFICRSKSPTGLMLFVVFIFDLKQILYVYV